MSESHLNPVPHPTASATTAPHPGATLAGEYIDAHLTATLQPGADLSYVIDSITVPVPGPEGPPGPAGEDGTKWFDGEGPPLGPIVGAAPGDYYLDTLSGNVWVLGQLPSFLTIQRITPGG